MHEVDKTIFTHLRILQSEDSTPKMMASAMRSVSVILRTLMCVLGNGSGTEAGAGEAMTEVASKAM